ncbi:MAG: cistern family PEP-CTERM protein [Leptospirillum sp.]|jgi:hypothetical protein
MKHSFLLKSLLAVTLVTTAYLPDAYAGFSFGTNSSGVQNVTMNASDVGQSFTANWLCSANTTCGTSGTTPKTLSATGTFTLDSYTSSGITLSATIKNTTSSSVQAALMSIGISAPGLLPSWGTAGSVFSNIGPAGGKNGNFPGGFKNVNACIYSANGCNGGKIADGLGDGYTGDAMNPLSTDSFKFILTSNSGTIGSSLTLSDFAVKFQTEYGSYEFGDGLGPSPTPEPGSFWLLGSALLAMIGFSFRKTMPQKA